MESQYVKTGEDKKYRRDENGNIDINCNYNKRNVDVNDENREKRINI